MSDELLIILHDGQELMRGDRRSMTVVFNNLTGNNFQGAEYTNYCAWMCEFTNTEIDPSKLELKGIEEAHGQTTTEPL